MKLAIISAVALVIALPGLVHAAVLVTHAVLVGTDPAGQFVRCTIVNVGGQSRPVTIEVVGPAGNVVASSNVVLQPGQVLSDADATGGTRYCRFVVQGAKGQFRAGATVGTLGREFFTVPAQ